MPQPVDSVMIQTSRWQHAGAADKLFARIASCAIAGREHLKDGQPATPVARQIGADLLELMAELAKLGKTSEFDRWTKAPAVKTRKAVA